MASKFQESQRNRQTELLRNNDQVFDGAKGGCTFLGQKRDFVITEGVKNIFSPIRDEVIKYFRDNRISWWGGAGPTGHILSSQTACLNHLFMLRNDKAFILRFLNSIRNEFTDIMPVTTDKSPSYIQFEAVSDSDHLNEGNSTRGTQCTSIDALVYARHISGRNWLIPIEWKYTEHYNNDNKAAGNKGTVRQSRYNSLIKVSGQLKQDNIPAYYYEPFYQLMRQTLWAEQMVRYRDSESLSADDFLHIHIIPSANRDLLDKKYPCTGLGMEMSWRNMLRDQSRYVIVDPGAILEEMSGNPAYEKLAGYLDVRYYQP